MIDVDSLQQRLTPQQVAAYYGVTIEFTASGQELRGPCPCAECDGNNDPRSISINQTGVKMWKCHRGGYGCGAQGKLLELAHCLKHGKMPAGKLAGQEFYAIAQDLQAMAGEGDWTPEPNRPSEPSPTPAVQRVTTESKATHDQLEQTLERTPNVPLLESKNENSRKIDRLDEQFTVKLEELPRAASAYARRRPFLLSEELAAECRFGYLPSNAKSMVRSKWVYGVMDEQGQSLAWIGRNTAYEESTEVTTDTTQSKYKFPRQEYFRRGQELYGQEFLTDPRFAESLHRYGLILTEGFTDRIRLHQLGVMSVAMMSNQLTDAQTQKLIRFASDYAGGRVGIMHDADNKGDEGAKESLWRLHNGGVDAYLAWSRSKFNGKFIDRQPESLTDEEWEEIARAIQAEDSQ